MKSHFTLIKNARLVEYGKRKITDCDILIKNSGGGYKSVVVEISPNISRESVSEMTLSIVDACGNYVVPSFTDLFCCFREPDAMYKEKIEKTLAAAQAGGYSRLLVFHENDRRQEDPLYALSYIRTHTAASACAVSLTAPIVCADSCTSCDMERAVIEGAAAFTDAFFQFRDVAAQKRAMAACAQKGLLYVAFATDRTLAEDGAVNNGDVARMLSVKGIGTASEEIAVTRALLLAGETGCRTHITGISTSRSVEFIRQAKKSGMCVTCDVSPNHIFFDEYALMYYGSNAKLLPPLRTSEDKDALIEGICDGTIDCIASHHVPNESDSRVQRRLSPTPLSASPFGAVGLQTVFPACVEKLLLTGRIDIFRLVELLSVNPAKVLCSDPQNISCDIEQGAQADMNIVSLREKVTVNESFIKGKALNTPFFGTTLSGKVIRNFTDGR